MPFRVPNLGPTSLFFLPRERLLPPSGFRFPPDFFALLREGAHDWSRFVSFESCSDELGRFLRDKFSLSFGGLLPPPREVRDCQRERWAMPFQGRTSDSLSSLLGIILFWRRRESISFFVEPFSLELSLRVPWTFPSRGSAPPSHFLCDPPFRYPQFSKPLSL